MSDWESKLDKFIERQDQRTAELEAYKDKLIKENEEALEQVKELKEKIDDLKKQDSSE